MSFSPDVLSWLDQIPFPRLRHRLQDLALEVKIPFNRSLGLHISHWDNVECEVRSAERRRRHNHVGGAHACFLALMAEYPAGLVLAKNFSTQNYRLILKELKMTYEKQGRGPLRSSSRRPAELILSVVDTLDVSMRTEIRDAKDQVIAVGETLWQIKPWEKVRKSK